MTVQVLEAFGLQRVESPRCDVCQGADESVTWVHEAGAYLCSTCKRTTRTLHAVPWSERQRQLARVAAGRREPIRYCCGIAQRRTKCPCRVRV